MLRTPISAKIGNWNIFGNSHSVWRIWNYQVWRQTNHHEGSDDVNHMFVAVSCTAGVAKHVAKLEHWSRDSKSHELWHLWTLFKIIDAQKMECLNMFKNLRIAMATLQPIQILAHLGSPTICICLAVETLENLTDIFEIIIPSPNDIFIIRNPDTESGLLGARLYCIYSPWTLCLMPLLLSLETNKNRSSRCYKRM